MSFSWLSCTAFIMLIMQCTINAQSEQLFYFFDFNGQPSNWHIEQYNINTAYISNDCPNAGTCWLMEGGSLINTTLSTMGYHSIKIMLDIAEINLFKNEYCYIQYKTPSTTWININLITWNDNKLLNNEISIPNNTKYNNQQLFYIRLGNNGNTANDKCLFDNLELFGIKYPTNDPTLLPTVSPIISQTQSPMPSITVSSTSTDNPSSGPTNNPSQTSTMIPTMIPTSTEIPTNNPSLYPSNNPTTNPTLNPTPKSTVNLTVNPTTNPPSKTTLFHTNTPHSSTTNQLTASPSFKPSIKAPSMTSSLPTISIDSEMLTTSIQSKNIAETDDVDIPTKLTIILLLVLIIFCIITIFLFIRNRGKYSKNKEEENYTNSDQPDPGTESEQNIVMRKKRLILQNQLQVVSNSLSTTAKLTPDAMGKSFSNLLNYANKEMDEVDEIVDIEYQNHAQTQMATIISNECNDIGNNMNYKPNIGELNDDCETPTISYVGHRKNQTTNLSIYKMEGVDMLQDRVNNNKALQVTLDGDEDNAVTPNGDNVDLPNNGGGDDDEVDIHVDNEKMNVLSMTTIGQKPDLPIIDDDANSHKINAVPMMTATEDDVELPYNGNINNDADSRRSINSKDETNILSITPNDDKDDLPNNGVINNDADSRRTQDVDLPNNGYFSNDADSRRNKQYHNDEKKDDDKELVNNGGINDDADSRHNTDNALTMTSNSSNTDNKYNLELFVINEYDI